MGESVWERVCGRECVGESVWERVCERKREGQRRCLNAWYGLRYQKPSFEVNTHNYILSSSSFLLIKFNKV